LQAGKRRLFQQNQGVTNIIGIGAGMRYDNFFDAH